MGVGEYEKLILGQLYIFFKILINTFWLESIKKCMNNHKLSYRFKVISPQLRVSYRMQRRTMCGPTAASGPRSQTATSATSHYRDTEMDRMTPSPPRPP